MKLKTNPFTQTMKSAMYLLVVLSFVGLVTTSCKTDSDEEQESVVLETFETQIEVEKATEEVNTIVEDVYFFEEITDTSGKTLQLRFLPDCVTITRVIAAGTKTLTLDFGDACELRNGNIVSGIITMQYTLNTNEQSKTIQISFTNFYFNDKNIDGNATIVRMRHNANGNPQSTHSMNIVVTWPDGTFASRQGQKTREWIEGVGTPFWGDNVYLITGNWTFTRRNGNVFAATITTPLRRELSCRFIVSGVLELNRNGNVATLDYGDGSCDALGVVTRNGVSHTILLRRR